MQKVLQRLRDAGLQVDIRKSEFCTTRTKFLEFVISTNEIEVDSSKVLVMQEWQEPTTVRGVQGFLGFCNFYCQFIRDYRQVARPLTALTRKNTLY